MNCDLSWRIKILTGVCSFIICHAYKNIQCYIYIYIHIYIYTYTGVYYPYIDPVPTNHNAKTYRSNKHTSPCFVTVLPVRSCFILTNFTTNQRGLDPALSVRDSSKIQCKSCHLATDWPTNENYEIHPTKIRLIEGVYWQLIVFQ